MIRLDKIVFEELIEFLQDCPGRISAAVVPGSAAGDAITGRLCSELAERIPVEVASADATPGELGSRAAELGDNGDAILIIPLDRHRFPSEDESLVFWRRLNYQRERLAYQDVRTCLLLDNEAEQRLALCADDLYEWVTFFRFAGAVPESFELSGLDQSLLLAEPRDDLREKSEPELDVLRDQWRRAREAGMPEAQLVLDHAGPLFRAFVANRKLDEADRLWERDLRSGDALDAMPAVERVDTIYRAIQLFRNRNRAQHQKLKEHFVAESMEMVAAGRALAAVEPDALSADLARQFNRLSDRLRDLGHLEEAQELGLGAVAVFEKLNDPAGLASSYHRLGLVAQDRRDLDGAMEWCHRSLRISEELGDRVSVAICYKRFGLVAQDRRDFDEALEWYRKSLKISMELEDRVGMAICYHQLGNVSYLQGAYEAALEWYRLAVEIFEEVEHRLGVASSYHQLGMLARKRDDSEEALGWFSRSLDISEELENRAGIARTAGQIGALLTERGDIEAAVPHSLECFAIHLDVDSLKVAKDLYRLRRQRELLGPARFEEIIHQHRDEQSAAQILQLLDTK
jgi:tetratricopeptide (TPR) repeat protein